MIIGEKITVNIIGEEAIAIRIDNKLVKLPKGSSFVILNDPFPEYLNDGAYIIRLTYDEFLSNINEDNEFIDDLMYIRGIAIENA